MSSVSASPILILPPRVILPSIFAFPANSNLPNEPVVTEEPLTFASSIKNAPLSATILANEPVDVAEPLIFPLAVTWPVTSNPPEPEIWVLSASKNISTKSVLSLPLLNLKLLSPSDVFI